MKKLIASTDDLKKALKKLGQAVSRKPQLPSLANIYVNAKEGEMELTTSDLELTISYSLPCECKQPFELLIPYDYFHKLLGFLGSQPLTIEQHTANIAVIVAEGETHRLAGLDKVKDFPEIPQPPVKNVVELDEVMMEWLGRAMATISDDDVLRPGMSQACLELDKGGVTIVSTNAHALFRRFFPKSFEGTPESLLIGPRLVKVMEGCDKVMLSWRQNHIALVADKLKVVATRLDAKFPNYRVVIPNSKPTVEVDRNGVLGALMKAELVNDQDVKFLFPAETTDRFVIRSSDGALGRVSEVTLSCRNTGNTEKIAFNTELFSRVLGQIPFDMIKLHIDGEMRGVVITSDEEANYLGLIMPLMNN